MAGAMRHRNDIVTDTSLTDLRTHIANGCEYFEDLSIFVVELSRLEGWFVISADLFGKQSQALVLVELVVVDAGAQA